MSRTEEIRARYTEAQNDMARHGVDINAPKASAAIYTSISGKTNHALRKMLSLANQDIPWLLAENARLEAELNGAVELITYVESCLNRTYGWLESANPDASIFYATRNALDLIKKWRGPQPATGAEERSKTES